MICGKMGTGKSTASEYLENTHGATRWSRSDLMKRLAHAAAFQVGDMEALLAAVLPDGDVRAEVRQDLLRYISTYEPEEGKPRRLYQDVAEIVIRRDPMAFERELTQRIEEARKKNPASVMLIDDVRSRVSFDWFVSNGYVALRMLADEQVRAERMRERDGYLPDPKTFQHRSETELDAVEVTFEVVNNSADASDLYRQLDEVMERLRSGALMQAASS